MKYKLYDVSNNSNLLVMRKITSFEFAFTKSNFKYSSSSKFLSFQKGEEIYAHKILVEPIKVQSWFKNLD